MLALPTLVVMNAVSTTCRARLVAIRQRRIRAECTEQTSRFQIQFVSLSWLLVVDRGLS